MELTRTEEQRELAAVVGDLVSRRADSAAVRSALVSESGYDTALWTTLCEQIGVAALAVPESVGGAGFSIAETLVVLEELGRSLAPTPLLASLLASEALLASGDAGAQERLLPDLAGGTIGTVAFGGDPMLYGAQARVLLAVDGDRILEVDPAVPRVPRPSMDITLQLAELDLVAAREGGAATELCRDPAAVARVRDVAIVGAAALQVGTMQRALDDTVAYTKQRHQFGRPIGSFQSLKHRMADMLVRLELSRSALLAASWALAQGSTESGRSTDATERAAVAGSYCSESLALIAGEMVQMHGGIAITWEHDAHLVLKRAHSLGTLFGQAHQHRARLTL